MLLNIVNDLFTLHLYALIFEGTYKKEEKFFDFEILIHYSEP